MQVDRNSIWQITQIDGIEDGTYRVLEHVTALQLLILFRLFDKNSLERPIAISHSLFDKAFNAGFVTEGDFPTPYYQLVAEESISKSDCAKRDVRFELIKDLLYSSSFLLGLLNCQRSRLISSCAKQHGVSIHTIYRYLNLYWKYGQVRNALLPAYKCSGGPGKPRLANKLKRGSPIQLSTPSLVAPVGVNTTEEDKDKFLKAMKRFAMKGKKVTYRSVYDNMCKEFYADEILLAERECREKRIPNYRAFIYWANKLVPQHELIRKQTSSGNFERNLRGLRGAATENAEVPGSCFELDSTVLDVHVVSELKRNHVLGRPTVYCVVDKGSRMIVGIHVSMEYASWRAGRQALVNSFTSKKEYCARFGIEIEDVEWPCRHIPRRLLCDRGEFVCMDAEKLAVPVIGHLSIAPPYRADLKGIVEQRFHILNEKLVHGLIGTTNGRQYIRGDPDPRLDAALTLTQITQLLINAILEHNSAIFDGLAVQSTLLIEYGLAPTPLNYWNIHIQKHKHDLNRADEAEIRAKLLPVQLVSMTSRGIQLYDDMYYECERPEFENWKVIARTAGRWKMETRVDQDNSSFIYVRLQDAESFTRCSLMKRSAILGNKHQADIFLFEDWKKLEKMKDKPSAKSVEIYEQRKAILKQAKDEVKNAPPLSSKAESIRGMRERRRNEIMQARIINSPQEEMEIDRDASYIDELALHKEKNVLFLLKRKKDNNK